VGTEERGQARVGIRRAAGRFALDAALIVGLEDPDPDLGVTLGLATSFHGAFGP
jgi:hypothetical protein